VAIWGGNAPAVGTPGTIVVGPFVELKATLAAGWRGGVLLACEVQFVRESAMRPQTDIRMRSLCLTLAVALAAGLLGCEGQLTRRSGDNAQGLADLGVDATGAADAGGGQAQDGQFVSSYGKQCTMPNLWTKGKCADGKAVCIFDISGTSSSSGFCTYPCAPLGQGSCPSLGAEFNGYKMGCVYAIKWPNEAKPQSYCVFVCRRAGAVYPCPKGFTCKPLIDEDLRREFGLGDSTDAWCSPGLY
jgi:hypothetical protein